MTKSKEVFVRISSSHLVQKVLLEGFCRYDSLTEIINLWRMDCSTWPEMSELSSLDRHGSDFEKELEDRVRSMMNSLGNGPNITVVAFTKQDVPDLVVSVDTFQVEPPEDEENAFWFTKLSRNLPESPHMDEDWIEDFSCASGRLRMEQTHKRRSRTEAFCLFQFCAGYERSRQKRSSIVTSSRALSFQALAHEFSILSASAFV
mmetsp:Transcript_24327/g.69931  ORF Transcript_24327/g.69931 Transcript_24327/m.69931 type:complete len:204 (+) Transcript_24327:593-1204(+)